MAQQLQEKRLLLPEVAPMLCALRGTVIPVPGGPGAGLPLPFWEQKACALMHAHSMWALKHTLPFAVGQHARAACTHTSLCTPSSVAGVEGVCIEAFLPTLHVLQTKTRPKRLSLLGSDGRQYRYLLKVNGREMAFVTSLLL